jgi:enamine deaminase RidA (YjgF/YER057c/UK114 family)
MHRQQLSQANRFSSEHGKPIGLSKGAESLLCNDHAACSAAVTLVEVSKLYGPDFLIEIEAIAVV